MGYGHLFINTIISNHQLNENVTLNARDDPLASFSDALFLVFTSEREDF